MCRPGCALWLCCVPARRPGHLLNRSALSDSSSVSRDLQSVLQGPWVRMTRDIWVKHECAPWPLLSAQCPGSKALPGPLPGLLLPLHASPHVFLNFCHRPSFSASFSPIPPFLPSPFLRPFFNSRSAEPAAIPDPRAWAPAGWSPVGCREDLVTVLWRALRCCPLS